MAGCELLSAILRCLYDGSQSRLRVYTAKVYRHPCPVTVYIQLFFSVSLSLSFSLVFCLNVTLAEFFYTQKKKGMARGNMQDDLGNWAEIVSENIFSTSVVYVCIRWTYLHCDVIRQKILNKNFRQWNTDKCCKGESTINIEWKSRSHSKSYTISTRRAHIFETAMSNFARVTNTIWHICCMHMLLYCILSIYLWCAVFLLDYLYDVYTKTQKSLTYASKCFKSSNWNHKHFITWF